MVNHIHFIQTKKTWSQFIARSTNWGSRIARQVETSNAENPTSVLVYMQHTNNNDNKPLQMVLVYNSLREAFGCFVSDLSMNLRDSNSSKPKRTKRLFCMYACNFTLQAWQIYMKKGRIYAISPTKKGRPASLPFIIIILTPTFRNWCRWCIRRLDWSSLRRSCQLCKSLNQRGLRNRSWRWQSVCQTSWWTSPLLLTNSKRGR